MLSTAKEFIISNSLDSLWLVVALDAMIGRIDGWKFTRLSVLHG